MLWEMDGISEGRQKKQLVFRDDENTDIHLPFIPGQLAQIFSVSAASTRESCYDSSRTSTTLPIQRKKRRLRRYVPIF